MEMKTVGRTTRWWTGSSGSERHSSPVRIRPGPRGPRVGDVGGSDGGGALPSEIPPPFRNTPSELFRGAGTLSILGLGAFVALPCDAGEKTLCTGDSPMRAGMESDGVMEA